MGILREAWSGYLGISPLEMFITKSYEQVLGP